MSIIQVSDTSDPRSIEPFFGMLKQSLDDHTLVKVVLGKNSGPEPNLIRVSARPIVVRGQECLSFVSHYTTRETTENVAILDGIGKIRRWMARSFGHAHLLTTVQDVQWSISKKGKCFLNKGKPTHTETPSPEHDREKSRFLKLSKPFWVDLGLANEQQQLLPSMSRKWKQINKFIEVFDHALVSSGLADLPSARVVDIGCGKGYLTFAIHDHLQNNRGMEAHVSGIELREDMVRLCNQAVQKAGASGFVWGFFIEREPG